MEKEIVYMSDMFRSFVIGGLVISSTSYIATFMSPLLGAIWWSYPFSVVPTVFYMKQNGKSNEDISKFLFYTVFALGLLVISTYAMSYFVKTHSDKQSVVLPILKASVVWLVCSIIFYGGVKILG